MRSEFLNLLPKSQLSDDLIQLHADFDYLGILKKYGSCCLFINSLLALCLCKKKYRAELRPCYASLQCNTHHFLLGHHQFVSAGQLAGHVACQISPNPLTPSHHLVDFGLGNLRKMVKHAPQAVAFAFWEQADYISRIDLSPEETLSWTAIEQIDNLNLEIQHQQATLIEVMSKLENFQQDRLRCCFNQALHGKTTCKATLRAQYLTPPYLSLTHASRNPTLAGADFNAIHQH